ncbi:MAG TPA: formyltransferase family protein [Solirubrobacteraceae bacterium]
MTIRRGNSAFERNPADAQTRLRVVLLRSDDPHQRWLERELDRTLELVGVVVEPGAAQQARLPRRRGVWWARRYQVLRQRACGRAAYRASYFDALAANQELSTPTVIVEWINDARSNAAVTGWAPDVIVVCGTTIVADAIIASAPLAINVHAGWLPGYRGNHAIYFAYERGDFAHIGASLHIVSSELDGGDLFAVHRPTIYPHDHDEHLYCRSVHGAGLLLCELLCALERGTPLRCTPQAHRGETFRHRDRTPASELRLWLRRRLGAHRVPHLDKTNARAQFRDGNEPPAGGAADA